MRSVSHNYQREAYILKLDIQGYFMAIRHEQLYDKIRDFLSQHRDKLSCDLHLLLELIHKTIHADPVSNCIIKGKRSDWDGLPPTKSLFHTQPGCGLPIGNLTSQLFANIYLNDFDHYVKRDLGIRHYGRYVDDFILMHPDNDYLKHCIHVTRSYLKEKLHLTLHSGKIYLQPISKGVHYLGAVLKPHRNYIASRTMGNMFESIRYFNMLVDSHVPDLNERAAFIQSMNSYLGIMGHYRSFRKRKLLIDRYMSNKWWVYVRNDDHYSKCMLRPECVLK